MRSWEADEDVAKLLDLALASTSASLKDIVNEALRTHGPRIVRRLLEERTSAEEALQAYLAEQFPENGEDAATAAGSPTGEASVHRRRQRRA